MKRSDLYLILSVAYIAPHLTFPVAMFVSIYLAGFAVYHARRES